MSKLKKQVDKAITLTKEGEAHIINLPELKTALLELCDRLELLELQYKKMGIDG